ncbi:hypothetical protein UlMin_025441 [Ulmus minor]
MSKLDPYIHLNFVQNPDGSITRPLLPTMPANPNPQPGELAASKDITLNTNTKTWLRLHCPTNLATNDNKVARLPIIIYVHHGSWVLLSADSMVAHLAGNQIANGVPAIIVSINYRLAPESRLPDQYDDIIDAIYWIKQQSLDPNGEQWVRNYGDVSRCYLYGRGCGGNIVFFVALKALQLSLEPLKISGIIMNQPMFGGVQRTKSELRLANDKILPLSMLDMLWELALPKGVGRNHWYCNPIEDGPHKDQIGGLSRSLVIGFGDDPMIDRQEEFVKMLVACGVKVDAHFDDVGFHNIDLVDPRRTAAIRSIIDEFIYSF